MQLLLKPILAVNIAGDDEGDDVVTGGIDHGCRGIDQIAQSKRYGIGNGKIVGEEDRAEHKLAGSAAAMNDGVYSAGGVAASGKIAVAIGFAVLLVISVLNTMKKEEK